MSWLEEIPDYIKEELQPWVERLNGDIEIIRSITKDHDNMSLIKDTIPTNNSQFVNTKVNNYKQIVNAIIKCNTVNAETLGMSIKNVEIDPESYRFIDPKIANVINSVKMGINGNKKMYSDFFKYINATYSSHFYDYIIENQKLTPELLSFIGFSYINKIVSFDIVDRSVKKCSNPRDVISFVTSFKSHFTKEYLTEFKSYITNKFPEDTSSGLNKFNLATLV